METFSALLAICAGNSPVPGEFPAQRPVTRNFDVFFDLRLTKRLSEQSWGWWIETPSRPLRRHRNVMNLQLTCCDNIIARNKAHAIVSWPNPKQWLMVHIADLMMIIKWSTNILTIIVKEMCKRKTFCPIYCIKIRKNGRILKPTHERLYLSSIL